LFGQRVFRSDVKMGVDILWNSKLRTFSLAIFINLSIL